MAESKSPSKPSPEQVPVCGIVMPISAIDGCSENHWAEVHSILVSAIASAGFKANLVSNANDVGIIQQRIIQNLYDNPVVVCDVSAKNPNVMFELGLRLAFDKPTIIVKDDHTSYSFDTGQIEHLEYPRDLRFTRIVEFKDALAEKIKATHKRATEDKSYTTFLKHFSRFKVAELDTKVVSKEDYILAELKEIRQQLSAYGTGSRTNANAPQFTGEKFPQLVTGEIDMRTMDRKVLGELAEVYGIPFEITAERDNKMYVQFAVTSPRQKTFARGLLTGAIRPAEPDVAEQFPANGAAEGTVSGKIMP